MSNWHWCWKNEQHLDIDFNFYLQVYLSKTKCRYSNNCLHFFKARCIHCFYFSQSNINFTIKFKEFQICAYFFTNLRGCLVISKFVIFHKIKVAEHIQNQCYQLVAETGNWFIQIPNSWGFMPSVNTLSVNYIKLVRKWCVVKIAKDT